MARAFQGQPTAAAPAAPATPKPAPAKAAAPKKAAPKTAPVAPAPDAGVDRLFDPGSHKRGGFEGRFDDPEVAKMTAEWAAAGRKEKMKPVFMDKLAKVRELRQQKEIGEQQASWDLRYMGSKYYPSQKEMTVETGKPSRGWFASEEERKGIRTVTPSYYRGLRRRPLYMPTEEDLNLPERAVPKIQQWAEEYQYARDDFDKAKAAVEKAKKDPSISKDDLPSYARRASDSLQRVAQLRAVLREAGWMDDREVEQMFPPTPRPR